MAKHRIVLIVLLTAVLLFISGCSQLEALLPSKSKGVSVKADTQFGGTQKRTLNAAGVDNRSSQGPNSGLQSAKDLTQINAINGEVKKLEKSQEVTSKEVGKIETNNGTPPFVIFIIALLFGMLIPQPRFVRWFF